MVGVPFCQVVFVVPATTNVDVAQVGAVGNTEVLEGYEEVVFECVPQADRGCHVAVKVLVGDVHPVFSFGGCGQADKFAGLKIVENFVPADSFNVVTFVHDDDIEIVRCIVFEGGT